MSDVSSSSSMPPMDEAVQAGANEKGKKAKKTKKFKSKSRIEEADDKDEDDPAPLPNMVRITGEGPPEFNWDAVDEDEDLEIWAIRIPNGMKAKHLENLQIQLEPPDDEDDGEDEGHGLLGSFRRGKETYVVTDASATGADELDGVKCLLRANADDGIYKFAPRGIARHLVITQSLLPSGSDRIPAKPALVPKPKRPQPTDRLKHRFVPVGAFDVSDAKGNGEVQIVDVDMDMAPPLQQDGGSKDVEMENADDTKPKKKKRKKDKADTQAPVDEPMAAVSAEVPESKAGKKRKAPEGEKVKKAKKPKREAE